MVSPRLIVAAVCLVAIAYFYNDRGSKYTIQDTLLVEYDYIIVGAGTAGCVLASRLSEDPSVSVLLLEAGEEDTKVPLSDVPLATHTLLDTDVSLRDLTVPQKDGCLGMNNKQCALHSGRGLGGSSTLNSLLYARGNRADYDGWAAGGATGWGYADVLPYFIKAEQNTNEVFSQSGYHGTVGPLVVSDIRTTSLSEAFVCTMLVSPGYHGTVGPLVVSDIRTTSLSEAFVQAGQELGYHSIDVNGETQEGFMHTQATISRGRRWSVTKAYLQPATRRPNLHLATRAHVRKVLFKGRTAVAVELTHNGTLRQILARKEIVLSAGTVGSAQLLMLSGVGPRKHLQELKISEVADLPVGDNLQDHLTLRGPEYTLQEPIAITAFKASSIWAWMDYLLFGTGYWSSPLSEGVAYISSQVASVKTSHPDIELRLHPMLQGSSQGDMTRDREAYNIQGQLFDFLYGNMDRLDGVGLCPTLLHPQSRGTLRLASVDPAVRPLIDPRYFKDARDAKVLVEGVRLAEKVASTEMFRGLLGARSLDRVHPLCAGELYESSAYWECYLRHNAQSENRLTGTCKMGASDDNTAVVDPQLRVRGLSNLRVVDASIMPTITAGNIYAPVVMIAERAADLITGKVTVTRANVTIS